MNDKEMWTQMLMNLNEGLLRLQGNVKEYMKVRKLHQEVIDSMMNYIQKNNIDPSPLLEKLEVEEFSLDFHNDLDNQVYGDLIVYPQINDIKSITEIYLDKHKFRKEEKIKMLEAMRDSKIGIYEIVDRDNKNAIVTLKDLISFQTIKITDKSLGQFGAARGFCFVHRIIQYEDIAFQTGISICFKKNNTIKKWLKRNRNLINTPPLFLIEIFNFYQKYGYKNVRIV